MRAEHRLPSGYLQVKVMVDGVRHYTSAHRLVWLALNGTIPHGYLVNHKNGIKDDNRPENLELNTPSENLRHAHKGGLIDQSGERNPAAKLSNRQCAQIRLAYSQGGYTYQQLAERFGVTFQAIGKVIRGRTRQKQGGPIATSDLRHSACERDISTGQFVRTKEPA